MSGLQVTERIIEARVSKGIKWSDVATRMGLGNAWVAAACLGQMTLTAWQAGAVGEIFGVSQADRQWLTVVPYEGSLPTAVPTDPLIYRFHELVSVYGANFEGLIHEVFGDGIMSAIDFRVDPQREPEPKSDRVSITMIGSFLPYKTC